MGNFARERGDLSKSASLLQQALQRDEGNSTARANLANTLRLLGRLEEAAAMYEEMTAQFPESSDLRYNLGRTYQDMGESDSARRSYLAVDEKSPHSHLALNNLGTLFESEGRLDSALHYYHSALNIGEGVSADARANVDRVGFKLTDAAQDLIKSKAFGEAGTLCRQFLSIEPFHRDALFWLSVALLYDGIYEESIEVNKRLVAAHPDYGEGYLQLGNALETAGRGSDASSVYRRLLAITDDERLRQVGSTRLSRLEAAGIR
jgi:tetratricopeptide (TPR) repeat protein